jgi:hypothetical protein
MSFFLFPSPKNPQFCFSKHKNVIQFFITNFLYSKTPGIQLFINIVKLIVPDILNRFLLTIMLDEEIQLTPQLRETLVHINNYVKLRSEAFLIDADEVDDINYIIRMGAWDRTDDKVVILLFTNKSKRPFAVAKVGSETHFRTIEMEYRNTRLAYDNVKDSPLLIAQPIAFQVFDTVAIYFEHFFKGVPLNNYLKGIFSSGEKENIYVDIINRGKDFLANMKVSAHSMTIKDFSIYFYRPLEACENSDLAATHPSKVIELKSHVDHLMSTGICSVWMHGDLWGGSILVDSEAMAVIDWEFFSKNGVPLWDFFSLAFHIGTELHNRTDISSDFDNYFTCSHIADVVDDSLLYLANHFQISRDAIPLLFQCYLLFNMNARDTDKEKYWQNCLEKYWSVSASNTSDCKNRLL